MSIIEFQPWPKIARLNRDIIVTEKIDGTNAAVVIVAYPFGGAPEVPDENLVGVVFHSDPEAKTLYHVYAQSRSRFITPGKSTDNYGFAGWVQRNAQALVHALGEGTHFGEWWGSGIQHGYGLKGGERRFSLFNVKRWDRAKILTSGIQGLDVVPVIYEGPFSQGCIDSAVQALRLVGSVAADFDRPEGIVVFHTASRESYKVTLEGDEAPKGAAAHANDEEKIAA